MGDTLIRGRVLTFLREPAGMDDTGAYRYLEDGGVLVRGGKIASVGDYSEIAVSGADLNTVDHRPHLLVPGLIDTHTHYLQMPMIGSYGAQLLDWLNNYAFPTEMKFADAAHAGRIADCFFDDLLRNGTTTAVAYCSVHPASAEAFFARAAKRNLRMIGGKVLMDRNAPEALLDTPQTGYDQSKALIARWHGKGRAHYAITPRFAITSTPQQLELAGALAAEHPDCFVQTHLSENKAEIAKTAELFPRARDYLDVYETHGLLGRKSLFGHCIHLTDRERAVMAETGSVAVFCPTSNLFIGSGLFDVPGLNRQGVRISVATDVGGGTSNSMLRTLAEGYKVLQLQHHSLNPLSSFHMMTLGNAQALSLESSIGTLEPGTDADIAVLDSRATPVMALRMETATSLAEELFVLQTLGDDRSVHAVYVAGEAMKPVAS